MRSQLTAHCSLIFLPPHINDDDSLTRRSRTRLLLLTSKEMASVVAPAAIRVVVGGATEQ